MLTWTIDRRLRTPLLLLALAEVSVLYSSVYFAGIVIFGSLGAYEEHLGSLPPRAALVAGIMLVSLVSMGLYQFHQRAYYREVAIRVVAAIIVGSFLLAVVFYSLPQVAIWRSVAFLAVTYSLIGILLLRLYFVRNVDENIFRRRTLIFGSGSRAQSISDLKRRADRRGFKVVGKIVAPGDDSGCGAGAKETNGESVSNIATRLRADEIVVAMDDRRGNLPVQEMLQCKLQGIDVLDLMEFLERETGKIRVDLVHPGWLIFSRGFRSTKIRRGVKRVFDIAVSAISLLLLWPLMLVIVLAIKCEDGFRAPVLYRQRRVGLHGDEFNILKFRSMREDAEADGNPQWALECDPRVTRVGAVIRKARLDELPQAINVLVGQMSIVGPRPERPEFVTELIAAIPYYAERHTVKPGITGWAQIHYSYGASEEDAVEKLQYELFYVKNQSLMLDLLTILQTVEVILWAKGSR